MLVQFGNNWIKKIPRLSSLRIFLIQLFPNWTACSPITYTNCTPLSAIAITYYYYFQLHHPLHFGITWICTASPAPSNAFLCGKRVKKGLSKYFRFKQKLCKKQIKICFSFFIPCHREFSWLVSRPHIRIPHRQPASGGIELESAVSPR